MASRLDEVFFDDIHAYLRVGRWAEAVAFYERELTREEKQDPSNRLGYAIALIREGRRTGGMKLLTNEITALPNAREQLRRYVIPHLMEGNLVEPAVALLERVLEAEPDSVEDHRLLGSLLGRMKRWDEAIAHAGQVIELRPNDYAGHTSYIQLLLQSGRASEAGAHAQSLGGKAAASARLANVALMALTRSGQGQLAAELATSIDDDTITEEILAGAIVRTLVEAGRPDLAITRGLQLLDHGWDHEVLRSNLAQAYLVSKEPDRYERAVEHLEAGLAISPNDPLMSYALGEALLRLRRYSEAIPPLAKAVELQPRVPQARALYARALKQTGRHAEAAQEFRTLLKLQPSSPRWHRYAAGALSQAGRQKEAAKLFDSFVAQRASSLPGNFEEGLDRLWQKIDELRIPQSRLDWAWGLRSGEEAERAEWDRRAKWGHLADHYLLDWLECRHDRIEEAMTKLADLDEADRVLGSVDRSRGMILASAHIGPMYAGPLALELLGVRSRWLASTPSVARTAYARSLISTSDQDDMQVAKSFMQSVREGYAVVIAVDGAINLGSPRIPFEGQEITYSSFAARTAHRLGVPSLFCAPYWDGERIGFVLERLPDASPEEEADDFADRWRDAFLSSLRTFLGGAPENLRLSGGIWRHIR
jgi:tetratricopeptide (TPR) repeat protein